MTEETPVPNTAVPSLDQQDLPEPRIHETALVEDGVTIGRGSSVWDSVHVRHGAKIGRKCIVGEKSYVAYDVEIDDLVKINASVYICAQVRIGRGSMISAHTVFTNDRFPRACDPDLEDLQTSDPTEETLWTNVEQGVTIGANATIGPGLTLGAFSMIGMGSVVTRSVPPHALVTGSPARIRGLVCRCGEPVCKVSAGEELPAGEHACPRCERVTVWPQPSTQNRG